ncbi:MAG: hypothetical protein J4G04_02760 [Nitrosopumilaceae archaeon]|nr:hypothetical protein [Nitrosopumilaceae archaeon]
MKLTPELRLHILETAGVYAARFGIPEPRILMSTREVLEMPRHITTGRRTTAYKYYGVAYTQYNIRKMPDAVVLEETIVHELVHMRFPYLSHGRRFNGVMRRGLGGARFKPYRKRGLLPKRR